MWGLIRWNTAGNRKLFDRFMRMRSRRTTNIHPPFPNRIMHIAKQNIPTKIEIPGAIARQALDFGDATGYGKIAGEYFSLGAGTDIAPLLKGLENDLCQAPHWGYLIEGEVTITYADGKEETISGGDLFYWPPGHSVKVGKDAEVILFSPQAEHCAVVNHMKKQLGG
jgi:hypothetical protein